jgi:hypothetical protein
MRMDFIDFKRRPPGSTGIHIRLGLVPLRVEEMPNVLDFFRDEGKNKRLYLHGQITITI